MYFTVAARQYDLTGDFSFNPGGEVREGVPGLSGSGCGYTETIEDGTIEATFATVPDLLVSALRKIAETKFQIECINGRKYYGDRLFCSKVDAIDPAKGTVKASFGHVGPYHEV
jgi:hypothetical protein